MPTVIPLNYAHVIHSLRLVGDNEPMAATYGVSFTAGPTAASVAAATSSLHTAFGTLFDKFYDSDWSLVATEVKARSGAGINDFIIGLDGNVNIGSFGAYTQLPQNSSHLVHKRTSVAGRVGRGRMYLPAVPEIQVGETGILTAVYVSSWNTELATWLADIAAISQLDGMELLHNSPGAGAALAPFPVTSLTMDPVIATQRRRLRK
jgi:hypothetical protein